MDVRTTTRNVHLAKRRAYRLARRDELNAKKRAWHAENKADQNAKSLAYFNERRDELLEKNRKYKMEHRPEMSGYMNTYRAEQREPGGKIFEFNVWLDALKLKPCTDCEGVFPTCAMDWDHVRGEKLFNLGAWRGQWASEKTKKLIIGEIAKCDLVCANCHRVRTKQRRQGSPGHRASTKARKLGESL